MPVRLNTAFMRVNKPQRGALLIIVMWFLVMLTLLVGTLVSETRLSAKVAFYNKTGVNRWALILRALRQTEMELMLQRMPPDEETHKIPISERQDPLLAFDGRLLALTYPLPANVEVRAFDHIGKLSLLRMNVDSLQKILEQRLGKDLQKITPLLDAWQDWMDADKLKRLNGAEDEYYQSLKQPYLPRNGALETLDELLLIKGFKEVFGEVNLESVFTLFSHHQGVNPNFASMDALAWIPSMNAEIAQKIIHHRAKKPFKNINELNEILQPINPEIFNDISVWLNFANTSNYYTIAIQVNDDAPSEDSAPDDQNHSPSFNNDKEPLEKPSQFDHVFAYTATVQAHGYAQPPKVLQVRPYGELPQAAESATAEIGQK